MSAPESFELVIDWLPLTPANRWYKGHWSKTAALVTDWRDAAIQAARIAKLPKGGDVRSFAISVRARHRTNHLTDFDAFAPAAKAIVDGLVYGPRNNGYGLTPDDGPGFVHSLTLLPSFLDRTKPDALIVTIAIDDASPSPAEQTGETE